MNMNFSKSFLHAINIYPTCEITGSGNTVTIKIASSSKLPFKTTIKGNYGDVKHKVAAVLASHNLDLSGVRAVAAIFKKRKAPKRPKRKQLVK